MRILLKQATLMAALLAGMTSTALAQQAFVSGVVKAEVYSGFGGTALADLTNNAAYPNSPTSVSFVQRVEYPPGPADGRPPAADVASNYGVRLSGFIIPTESANYLFYIAADDGAAFFLSTDDTPANRRLLAWEPTWNPVRSFEVDASAGRTGCLNGDCENISVPVALVANQRYYFEALMKEAGGGDNLAVAWAKEGEALATLTYPNPDATVGGDLVTQLPIGSANIGTMADTTVSITRQPSSTAGAVGGTATFGVGINATPGVTYQWRKNGVNIANATNATFVAQNLATADNNAIYSVVVTKTGGNTVTSSDATLTVASLSEVQGVALLEIWNGIGGTAVPTVFSTLPAPSSYGTVTALNSDPFFSGVANSVAARNDYLGKMSGYFIPRVSGNYDFFIRSDDASALWISPNATFPNPETATPIARETDCCDAFMDPFVPNDDGTTYPTTEAPIAMVANQKYAFVYYWKEGGGGDFGQVAFRLDTDATAPASLTPIAATNLAAFVPGLGITVHPQNISVEENRGGSFSVGTLSTPGLTFQWQSAPAGSSTFANIAGATNRTYAVTSAPRANNNTQYRVVVTSGTQTATSNPAVLAVTDDVTPPTVASVGSFHNRTGVVVYFNEPVNAAGGTFTLSGGATVQSTTVLSPTTVFLQTAAPLTANTSYTVTVANVRDLSANGGNLVTPNTATFTSSAAAPTPMTEGFAKYERWDALTPTTIAQLLIEITNRPPDVVEAVVGFEGPPISPGDNYGGRITGWVVPPEDGNYVFSMATDDSGRLWLSTDSNPVNKKLIAQEASWSNSRIWSGKADQQSSTFAGSQWPGRTISLKAGQPYYLELIWQEGGGGDHGSATFWKADGAATPDGAPTTIRGSALLGNIAVATDGPPIIVSGPTGRIFNKGDAISLTVNAVGAAPLTYQWLRNKMPVAGATSQTYTIASANHTHVGDYSVLVSNAQGAVESNYRSADDSARLIMNGAYVIEAEDYNYEGGKHLTVASTMPYLGNAYSGLLPTLDVDYFNSPDQSAASTDADAYGPRMPISGAAYIETKGDGDGVNNAFNRNRGSFTLTANYALGWGDTADWQNYTRTFPSGRYAIFAGVAQDGDPGADVNARLISMNSTLSKVANPTVADGSAVGAEGGAQGLTTLGVFQSPQSGAWSSNDLIPLINEATGTPVEVQLSGTETLRWTLASGLDSDFLLLYCLDCVSVGAPNIAITRSAAGAITINYTGTLQAAASVTGPYTAVTGASSPFTVSATGPMRFFRTVR